MIRGLGPQLDARSSPDAPYVDTGARGGSVTRVVSLSAVLRRMGACQEARDWVRATGNAKFADTWHACTHEEWMWWLAWRVQDYIPHNRLETARMCAHAPAAHRRAIPARVMERAILAWWAGQKHTAVR